MSLRRTFRFAALLAPLLFFAFALTLPYSSTRLSLILHGYPFARVVSKDKLDIFQFVQTDSFSYRAVVFSDGKAVGLIDQPTGAFAMYEPFSSKLISLDYSFSTLLDALLCIVWSLRWFLLSAEAVFLLLWLRQRGKKLASES